MGLQKVNFKKLIRFASVILSLVNVVVFFFGKGYILNAIKVDRHPSKHLG